MRAPPGDNGNSYRQHFDAAKAGLYARESRPAFAFLRSPKLSVHCWKSATAVSTLLYRNVDAQWHFPQENATSHDLQTAALESKSL
jgi:hypothetical protein